MSVVNVANSTKKTARDTRLDFWRGLCLIDMVLLHLSYDRVHTPQWLRVVMDQWLRFAAGGFIFLAGVAVACIFLKKAIDPQTRGKTYWTLVRRSFYLLLVHYAVSLSFVLIYPIHDYSGAYPQTRDLLLDVLCFRYGCDLLLFYSGMMLLAPAMLELVRRGHGWALGLLSVVLFTVGQYRPYEWIFPIQSDFVFILWQFIFIAGVLAGAALPHYDRLTLKARAIAAACMVCLATLVAYTAYGPWGAALGIPFLKCPLSPGEAVRYLTLILSIMMVTDVIWKSLRDQTMVRWTASLGQKSLAVYVAHIWLLALLATIASRFPRLGDLQFFILGPIALAVLLVWVKVLDRLSEPETAKPREIAITLPFARLAGATVAAVMMLFFVHAIVPDRRHQPPSATVLAKAIPPANLSTLLADISDSDAMDDADEFLPDLPADPKIPEEVEV